MVNLTRALLMRNPRNHQCDPHWKRRQILKLSAHFYGRKRNCFSIAIRAVYRSLQYMTKGRKSWKIMYRNLWDGRLTAACRELGYTPGGTSTLLESLAQSQVLLNRQSLANLAIWEPRTFKALNKIAATKSHQVGFNDLGPRPIRVITRGML